MTDQELNEAVVIKLGWNRSDYPVNNGQWWERGGVHLNELPDYCHSIEAAWEIVEKMPKSWSLIRRDDGKFVCTFLGTDGLDGGGAHDTAPMAIVEAFLKLP